MPWTLYRYVLRELVKLLVLAAGVLVVLISFVAALKPMSEGMLSGDALLRFMGFTAPTMLLYALPFAGALAGTLVFLRMAADNEILACSASGMSYRAVLLPAGLLGLVLTMGLFLLSNLVLPQMFLNATRTIEADVMNQLVTQLNRNRPFDRFGGMILYADRAEQAEAPHLEGSTLQPEQLIRLDGVAVARSDEGGRLRRDVTAQRANVLLFREGGADSWVTIRLRHVMYHDPERGELAYTERYDVPPMRLPNPFLGRPKYYSWFKLRELNRNPDGHQPVRERRRLLAGALASAELHHRLRAALGPGAGEHRLTLRGPREDERYTFHAPSMREEGDGPGGAVHLRAADGEPATVVYQAPHRADRRIEAQRVVLRADAPEAGMEPTVRAELHEARIFDPRLPGEFTERAVVTLPRLRWGEPLAESFLETADAWTMLHLANEPRYDGAPRVGALAAGLERDLTGLARSIVSRMHERAASAVACLLLVLLGAVMSMRWRHQMPLVVYFGCFLLAIVTLLLINVGESMASGTRFALYVGLALLWSGNVMLATITGWLYCQLAKN